MSNEKYMLDQDDLIRAAIARAESDVDSDVDSDVTFHMDLEDARILQRLAELGAHHKAGAGISNRDDDRVLCYLSLQIVQAERRASENRELAVFGPATEVRA